MGIWAVCAGRRGQVGGGVVGAQVGVDKGGVVWYARVCAYARFLHGCVMGQGSRGRATTARYGRHGPLRAGGRTDGPLEQHRPQRKKFSDVLDTGNDNVYA